MNKYSRSIVVACLVAATTFGVVGCAAQAKPAVTPSATHDILTRQLPADVSAKGVLLAAVLLSTADITTAVENGLVTPAEVATAQQAMNDGTLDFWRQRAESDLNSK